MPKSIDQLTEEAAKGDVTAMSDLALRYYNGDGTGKDKAKAVTYWKQAAEKGHRNSQYNLAECYRDGDGMEANTKLAFAWFYIASKAGDAEATTILEAWEETPAYRTAWFNAARVPNGKAALEALHTEGHVTGEENINRISEVFKATALHLAAQNNCVANLKYLLSLGAVVDIQTADKKETPLDMAAKAGHRRCVYLLGKAGANLENVKAGIPAHISRLIDLMVKRQEDTKLLVQATHDNLHKELMSGDTTLHDLNRTISLLDTYKQEIVRKSDNNQYYKNSTPQKIIDIIALFRQQHSAEKPEDYPEWIEGKRQAYIKNLRQQHDERVAALLQLADQHHHLSPPLQWGMPRLVSTPAGMKDDFVYPGSTAEKTVHVPYTDIHKQLIDSNWLMRAGENPSQNYLLAHVVFIVSAAPHEQKLESATGETHYMGGRTFIDFPIMSSMEIMAQPQEFTDQKALDTFLEDQGVSSLGTYRRASSYQHSEAELASFFKSPTNVQEMLSVLKSKLASQYGTGEGFKLYAVELFVNSQKNVCGGGAKKRS